MSRVWLALSLVAALLMVGCSDDEEEQATCVVGTSEGCESHLVCEEVEGGQPACFGAFEVRGKVFDMSTNAGVAGATIVGLDANNGARTTSP